MDSPKKTSSSDSTNVEKACITCRHMQIPLTQEPCKTCRECKQPTHTLWEPKETTVEVEGNKAPGYYQNHPIEPLVFIESNGLPFWKGCVIKYIMREGLKRYEGKTIAESTITDLEKAKYYIDRKIQFIKENGEFNPTTP